MFSKKPLKQLVAELIELESLRKQDRQWFETIEEAQEYKRKTTRINWNMRVTAKQIARQIPESQVTKPKFVKVGSWWVCKRGDFYLEVLDERKRTLVYCDCTLFI